MPNGPPFDPLSTKDPTAAVPELQTCDCWVDPFREHSGKCGKCGWVWGVCVLSELGGGCGNSAWGGMWGGMCFFLRSEPPLRPLFPPNPDTCSSVGGSSMPSTKKKVRGAFLPFELCTPFIGIMSPPFCFLLRENVAGRKRSMENAMPV